MSLARHTGLKSNSSKLNPPMAPSPPPLGKIQNEEIQRMNADLNLLSTKLMEMQNSAGTNKQSSSFVSSIRESTSTSSLGLGNLNDSVNFSDLKLQILEKIIGKMIELDRFILRSTEPQAEEGDGGPRPARRASRGLDLTTFPTHLHIIDRLSDIHSKAQRVAVIVKNGGGGTKTSESSISAEAKTQIKNFESQVAKLTNQVKESDKLVDMKSNENKMLKEQIIKLQSESKGEKDISKKNIEDLKSQVNDLNQQIKTFDEQIKQANAENMKLIESNKANEGLIEKHKQTNITIIEERLEVELNQKESLINALLSMSQKISNHCDTTFLTEQERQSVSPEVFNALDILQNIIIKRLDELHLEMNNMRQEKDMLESDIKTYILERDMCGKDIENLNQQVQTLRMEKFELESKCTKQHLDTNEDLLKEIEKLRDENRRLSSSLTEATIQVSYMESYKEELHRLEFQMSTVRIDHCEEVQRYLSQIEDLHEENINCKRLTEHLKKKIKELSTKTASNDKDFLDTFEEVMQEEMMTMKTAFEGKLKKAKKESEETTRKHQMEINRMKDANTNLSSISPSRTSLASLIQARGMNMEVSSVSNSAVPTGRVTSSTSISSSTKY